MPQAELEQPVVLGIGTRNAKRELRAAAWQFQLCIVVRSAQGREQRLLCMSMVVRAFVQRERLCMSRFCTRFCAVVR